MGLLAVTLPVVALFRLTQMGPATTIIAYTLVGLTSPQGIDSPAGLEELTAKVAATGSETLTVSGVAVTITRADVQKLSPRQLRLKVFGAFAAEFYRLGAKGVAASHQASPADATKLQSDATALSFFTSQNHARIGLVAALLVGLSALLTGLLVLFSYRVGRLVSPGLVLGWMGASGLALAAVATHLGALPAGTARPASADGPLALASGFANYLAPLVVPYLASTYLAVLGAGLFLLVLAVLVRLVIAVKRRRSPHLPA